MPIDHERVEAVAADLRALPLDPETRLLALAETWRKASADELMAVIKRVGRPETRTTSALQWRTSHPTVYDRKMEARF